MGDVASREEGAPGALGIHAVVRSGWSGWTRRLPGRSDRESARSIRVGEREVTYRMVRSGELSAAVTDTGTRDHGSEDRDRVHDRVVADLLQRRTVAPLPYGCSAPDTSAVRRFLARSETPLLEALDTVEGCYEMRLHALAVPGEGTWERLFDSLAVRARSARRLESPPGARHTAAFLVPRGEWIDFVEGVSALDSGDSGLALDVTGPWAPYDFVRFSPEPGEGGGP